MTDEDSSEKKKRTCEKWSAAPFLDSANEKWSPAPFLDSAMPNEATLETTEIPNSYFCERVSLSLLGTYYANQQSLLLTIIRITCKFYLNFSMSRIRDRKPGKIDAGSQ
jgi:hypothetical protein